MLRAAPPPPAPSSLGFSSRPSTSSSDETDIAVAPCFLAEDPPNARPEPRLGTHTFKTHAAGVPRPRPGSAASTSSAGAFVEDLSVAFAPAPGLEEEESSDEEDLGGAVLDAPILSPVTTDMQPQADAALRTGGLGSGQGTGAAPGALLHMDVGFEEAPSPATQAIVAAAAEMRSWEHRMNRMRAHLQQKAKPKKTNVHHGSKLAAAAAAAVAAVSAATASAAPGAVAPTSVRKSVSREMVLKGDAPSCSLSSKAASMPCDKLDIVGTPDLTAQALAVSQGLSLSLEEAGGSPVHGHKCDAVDNPWHVMGPLTPGEVEEELYPENDQPLVDDFVPLPLYPSKSAKGMSTGSIPLTGGVPRGISPLQLGNDDDEDEGSVLDASPVVPKQTASNRALPRSISTGDQGHLPGSRAEKVAREELSGGSSSGPSSLTGSPARSDAVGVPLPTRRTPPLQAPSGPVRQRTLERQRPQVGRLGIAASGAVCGPTRMQASMSAERMRLNPTLGGLSGKALSAPRSSPMDLYPCSTNQGARGTAKPGSGPAFPATATNGGAVRSARSLSPASWKRDFPALDIPFNAFDSPRSPPKPILVGPKLNPPQAQSNSRRRR